MNLATARGLPVILIFVVPHVNIGAFGTLGVGGGFALGAKLCRPDSEVFYYLITRSSISSSWSIRSSDIVNLMDFLIDSRYCRSELLFCPFRSGSFMVMAP